MTKWIVFGTAKSTVSVIVEAPDSEIAFERAASAFSRTPQRTAFDEVEWEDVEQHIAEEDLRLKFEKTLAKELKRQKELGA